MTGTEVGLLKGCSPRPVGRPNTPPACRVPVGAGPPDAPPPPLPPHPSHLRPPGRTRGRGVPVGVSTTRNWLRAGPAVDAGAETREGAPSVACGGGRAGRPLATARGGGPCLGSALRSGRGWRAGRGVAAAFSVRRLVPPSPWGRR